MINLFILDYCSLGKYNGLGTYIEQLSKQLRRHKKVALNFIWIRSIGCKYFEKQAIKDVTHYYISNDIALPNDLNGFDIKVADWLAAEMKDKENIIFHFNWINHASFAYLLGQKINCKTLLTKHCIPWRDLITGQYPVFLRINKQYANSGISLSVSPPALLREQMSYHTIDHIISVTQSGKSSLQKMLRYPAEKVSVVYNGIQASELTRGKRDKRRLRKQYGFASDEIIILFAGAVNERKGAYDLTTAFENFTIQYPDKRIRLVFAGEGDYGRLLKTVRKTWARITITGALNKMQLYDFYTMADMGVAPSYVEQCSYTAIEMMCAGLPIIVADVDGLKEIVPDDCGLKVRLQLGKTKACIDRKDLQHKLLYFIENPAIAQEYAQRAKSYAVKNLTAKRMAAQTIEVYKKLLVQNEPPAAKLTKTPLVSIILPVYNGGAFIADCIDSILQQTYTNYELILIDDDSTDNTAAIIKGYHDNSILYVKNHTNKGIVYSLNKGIALAKGKYIARIDADDRMHKTRLEKQVRFLETHSDTAMVGSWHYVMDQSGKIIGLKEYPAHDKEIKMLLPFGNTFSHPSVMMLANVVKTFGYNHSYTYCEDYELWMKITAEHKAANITECLTYYRIHPGNGQQEYLETQRQATLELQSDWMDEWGLEPSVEELAIHAAIGFGNPRQYFAAEEKAIALMKWVDKVLANRQNRYNYSNSFVQKVKEYLLYDYCGVKTDIKPVMYAK